jgi:nucleotide-binding universal stress UspA family protein
LVVGNRGAGGFASLHLGSVAHHLARHTTRPLAIVPEPTAAPHPDTIVVGVDGSAGSTAAISWCARVAPALGARVVAVLAFEPFIEWVPDDDPKSWRRTAEWEVARWIEPLRDVGTPVEVVVAEGLHPVTAIADTATARAAQLIIVGTHGLGGFTKMRLGGVAVQLVHHAGLPVVLVPRMNEKF